MRILGLASIETCSIVKKSSHEKFRIFCWFYLRKTIKQSCTMYVYIHTFTMLFAEKEQKYIRNHD